MKHRFPFAAENHSTNPYGLELLAQFREHADIQVVPGVLTRAKGIQMGRMAPATETAQIAAPGDVDGNGKRASVSGLSA